MLVRLTKNKNNNNTWDIESLGPILYRQKIGTTESARLREARFQPYSITGRLVALHGACLEEAAYESPDVIRAIGLCGTFAECHHQATHDPKNSGWFNSDTVRPVWEAKYINLMGDNVYYSRPSDITQDREAMAKNEAPSTIEDSVLAPDQWTAMRHIKAAASRLKSSIMGG